MKAPVGRVYVLTNPRMTGLVKIGFTLGAVENRAKELDATGTPAPFEIAYQVEVRGPDELERRAHEKLMHRRVRTSREFFEVDVVEAIICIRGLATEVLGEECHPHYVEFVYEEARRRAELAEEQRLAKERADYEQKVTRFLEYSDRTRAHQGRISTLKLELENLRLKLDSAPRERKLTYLESRWHSPQAFILAVIVFFIALLVNTNVYPNQASVVNGALLAAIFLIIIFSKRTWSSAKKKKAHNLEIIRLNREIKNAEFDLEELEHQKIYLPSELAGFRFRNPVRRDERGFEAAARRSSRSF